MLISIYKSLGLIFLTALLILVIDTNAQTIVKGKVTDATTGDPIPFANVFFKNTTIGTTTDFNGYYTLQTIQSVDSLVVSYVGYFERSKVLVPHISQELNFQLDEQVMNLKEVVFYSGENPANEILRRVIRNKDKHDKRQLAAYQYDSYNKTEIDVDNISDKMRQKKIMRKISQVMDSIDVIAGEDGKPILPLFISESITQYFFRKNPKLQHEKIIKTKMSGVGIEDGSLVSQLVGSSFQEYNFYRNWLNIVEKEFISPIADGWRMYYEYDLLDSGVVDGFDCYRLDFFPKRDQDLAFSGTMWITKDTYALLRIDASVLPAANLNYVEKIKIQQELVPTEAGAWLPQKTRVLINIGEINKNMAGMLAKFYSSNKNIIVNKPLEERFYALPIEMARDVNVNNGSEFWEEHRHEPLSSTEQSVYAMIDTLKSIPVVKTYTELLKIIVNGYKKAGPLDLGPYLSLYANNNIEGHRLQLGARTNIHFSNKWILGGYGAYGSSDKRFKFNGFAEYLIDRDRWTSIKVEYANDIEQVGLAPENLSDNYIFMAATRFGDLTRPYSFERYRLRMSRDLFKGYRQTVSVRTESFDPLFPFEYITDQSGNESPTAGRYDYSEISIESRYAKDELIVIHDNQRLSLGTLKWPVISLKYTIGINGFLGGDFDYHKIRLNLQDDIVMGFLGTSSVSFTAEQIFGELPYPLLEAHIGNESSFYTSAAYNLMDFSEFISDRYVSLKYNHYFQGFILNRIPLMKKLKWRLLATGNILYGELGKANQSLIPPLMVDGQEVQQDFSLNNKPYIEVGYGIENIFKIGRIDFLHRLSHLDNKPDVNRFGIKFSLQFIL